jgi:hypothetical protein
MGNPEFEKIVLRKLRFELINALSKLDEKGTDETVSKAMSIVATAFESVIERKSLTSEEMYDIGCERAVMPVD